MTLKLTDHKIDQIKRLPRKLNPEEITLDVLEECRRTVARIIVRYGDEYTPIFERLNNEIAEKGKKKKVEALIRQIANDNG